MVSKEQRHTGYFRVRPRATWFRGGTGLAVCQAKSICRRETFNAHEVARQQPQSLMLSYRLVEYSRILAACSAVQRNWTAVRSLALLGSGQLCRLVETKLEKRLTRHGNLLALLCRSHG